MSNPFAAAPRSTREIDVSASSQRIQLTAGPGIISVEVYNAGTATAWFEFGDSNVTASSSVAGALPAAGSSRPVAPGAMVCHQVKKTDGPIYVAAIAAGATGKIHFTPGTGI